MAIRLQEWMTELLGFQAAAKFGGPQAQMQFNGPAVDCSTFFSTTPAGFEATSLAVLKNNFAVVPTDWLSSGVGKPWYSIESHSSLVECVDQFRQSSFVAFNDDFLDIIGRNAKLEMIHKFSGIDAEHVHEAPVYVPTTNELVFADTIVNGWLWALNIDTHTIRKVNTSPPLENVNGATMRDGQIYVTTNGGSARGIWTCPLPTKIPSDTSSTETISCTCLVNNYHLTKLNSPNDLIFTATDNILFTDPLYGWAQEWPGVGPPELPTATYYFNTKTGALITLENDQTLQPNGLALSMDAKTLYIADSNSTSSRPVKVWEDSVRNVYAFDWDEASLTLNNRRLVHVVESGWPDGLRVSKYRKGGQVRELVFVACMGGVDVVDVSSGGAGTLLGKFNVGDDIIFNLEPATKGGCESTERFGAGVWLMTGKKGVYRLDIASVA